MGKEGGGESKREKVSQGIRGIATLFAISPLFFVLKKKKRGKERKKRGGGGTQARDDSRRCFDPTDALSPPKGKEWQKIGKKGEGVKKGEEGEEDVLEALDMVSTSSSQIFFFSPRCFHKKKRGITRREEKKGERKERASVAYSSPLSSPFYPLLNFWGKMVGTMRGGKKREGEEKKKKEGEKTGTRLCTRCCQRSCRRFLYFLLSKRRRERGGKGGRKKRKGGGCQAALYLNPIVLGKRQKEKKKEGGKGNRSSPNPTRLFTPQTGWGCRKGGGEKKKKEKRGEE